MQKALVVKGRLAGPTSVVLNEPVVGMTAEVEVLLQPMADANLDSSDSLSQFIRRLPAGKRSNEDIDQQIHSERAAWRGL